DRGTEPRQRGSQIVVRDLGQVRGKPRRCRGVRLSPELPGCPPQRRLPECDALNSAPTEEAIDPLADHLRKMLNLDCGGTFDAKNECAGRPHPGVVRARPLNLDRLADGSNLGARNLWPARDQLRRRKALPRKSVAHDFAEEVA